MSEFQEACGILVKHAGIDMDTAHIRDVAHSLDLNKDGQIDFNEFLEAFRLVDIGDEGLMRGDGMDAWSPSQSSSPPGMFRTLGDAEIPCSKKGDGGIRVRQEHDHQRGDITMGPDEPEIEFADVGADDVLQIEDLEFSPTEGYRSNENSSNFTPVSPNNHSISSQPNKL